MTNRLANYVPVAERVNQAQSELVAVDADPPVMLTDVMGYIRVAVYLSDGRKATGTASFRLDLDGRSAQATNPIEDCETSAVGRALAFLGFSSSRSIASREEVRTAEERGASYKKPAAKPAPEPPATDKQRNYIAILQDKLRWSSEQLAEYAHEQGIDLASLTASQAKPFIDGLKALAEERSTAPAQNGEQIAALIARITALVAEGTGLNIKLPAAPKALNQMSYAELVTHGKALRAAVDKAQVAPKEEAPA